MAARWCSVLALAVAELAGLSAAELWQAQLAATTTGTIVYQGSTYASSSSLRVSWNAPVDVQVDHYALRVTQGNRHTVQVQVEGDAVESVVEGLKSATSYTIQLRACIDAACEESLDANESVNATVPAEYWRVVGTGAGYANARRVVRDGNVGSHAFRYGPWAGPEKDGTVQLYYTPLQREEKGVKIGQPAGGSTSDPIEAALNFDGISGFGLLRACGELPMGPGAPPAPPACVNPQGIATGVNLYQAVPLMPSADGKEDGKIRLYFEAPGRGGRQRIVYLDSQDGYLGRDFHRGAATRCDTPADYGAGGGCEPALAIGVDIDGPNGNRNLLNARQFKIAWPTAVSTAWDQSPGTFMWFTTEWRDGRCSTFGFNAAYAVWDGSRWEVPYGENDCPKVLAGVQAPMAVHIDGPGPARYKLYFSRHVRPGGPSDPRIAIKPFQVLYVDPELTGDEAVADFEDWEPVQEARDVHFLWPDGTQLTEDEESRLDDFVVFAPGPDPTRLVMYSDMSFTGLTAVPFIGAAVLLNP